MEPIDTKIFVYCSLDNFSTLKEDTSNTCNDQLIAESIKNSFK
jgi:hypothetical protein